MIGYGSEEVGSLSRSDCNQCERPDGWWWQCEPATAKQRQTHETLCRLHSHQIRRCGENANPPINLHPADTSLVFIPSCPKTNPRFPSSFSAYHNNKCGNKSLELSLVLYARPNVDFLLKSPLTEMMHRGLKFLSLRNKRWQTGNFTHPL